ncbi:MAG: ATP synthase F0 subunit C [Thermodesulfovibrio sp.]|nr:ATP synthase F0 subunit C [Thermodesulfovibrio sp.]
MKRVLVAFLLMGLILSAGAVFAAEPSTEAAKLNYYGFASLGALVGIGLAAGGGGIGMGHGLRGIMEGSARNPAVSGKLLTTFIIGLALIETLVIYTLVIVLITYYANPFVK